MYVKHSHEVPSQPLQVGSGASKAVLISDQEAPNFAMRKFTIQPGGSMPMHYNLVEHEQYVLSGKALVIINDIPYAWYSMASNYCIPYDYYVNNIIPIIEGE